jgi:hypothetical protein
MNEWQIGRLVVNERGKIISSLAANHRVYRPLTVGSSRRSPPGGYSARVKGLDTQVRALES